MTVMQSNFKFHRQRGAVLFVALVFLVLVTLLALTASSTSVLQERMTGGLRNSQLSLMGAESALRSVEWQIWNRSSNAAGSNKFDCNVNGGVTHDSCYSVRGVASNTVTVFRNSLGWLGIADGGQDYKTQSLHGLSGAQASAQLQDQPRYLIEDLGIVLPPNSPANGEGGGRDQTQGRGPPGESLYAFRVTARSPGGNEGAVRAAESIFIALPPSH